MFTLLVRAVQFSKVGGWGGAFSEVGPPYDIFQLIVDPPYDIFQFPDIKGKPPTF